MHKILVVDDDFDLLSITKSLLERNDFEVHAISNANDIDAVIASFNPEVILLDISIGNEDGRIICRELKTTKGSSHLPVLLFSANLDVSDTLAPYLADGFVEKPFSKNELLNSIHAALGK